MSVQRESMRDQVKRVLLNRILDGIYQPGDRLVELQIAHELNTSQGPVREALRELEGLRLVESQTYRGTYVRGISAEEMYNAYLVRGVLEELAAQLAAGRFKDNAAALVSEVEAMKTAAKTRDLDQFAQHNATFHRLIIEASGNPILLQVWESLTCEVRTRINLVRIVDQLEAVAELHQPIVEALVQGNGNAAGQLLRGHFDEIQPPEPRASSENSSLKSGISTSSMKRGDIVSSINN